MQRRFFTRLLPFTLVCLVAACRFTQSQETQPGDTPANAVVFYAMGDVPYSPADDQLLPRQIAQLPHDGLFAVHVGDIKPGSAPCDEAVYRKVSGMLGQSPLPMFIIPGDNEWNDCTDPAAGWAYWQEYFARFDERWHHQLPVFRQLEREENFSFVHEGVLFIGLNLVGGALHDADEWRTRLAQNIDWTRRNFGRFGNHVHAAVIFGHAHPRPDHNGYFNPLSTLATEWGKPILYLHGDGHRWLKDRPFAAKNILRVQVDQGGIAPPLKVTVTNDADEPFHFDRRK